jgi:hypothetical protein
MTIDEELPLNRFLQSLEIVVREARHLSYSRQRLFSQPIDATWVTSLEQNPELAEKLEAFVSRFGRMQDTITDKLLPRWLVAQAEKPGSVIETLNRSERLGVITNVEDWLAARKLRNRLVHEYLQDAHQFAEDLKLANEYSQLLFDFLGNLHVFAITRMGLMQQQLPTELTTVIQANKS